MLIDSFENNIATVTRPELLGFSNLCNLPLKKPSIMKYSIECTNGEQTIVKVKDTLVGSPRIVLIAGPCSLENEPQMWEAALAAKVAGAVGLRGGAFKPRTSPYSFQGNGETALIMQRKIADELGMFVVTEATGEKNLPSVAKYADIIQIGARNSQNFELLSLAGEVAGKLGRAILYKRGPWMSINEWMLATEYILASGCKDVILCERGTNLNDGGYGLDTQGIVSLRKITHLPIIADPTHSAKKSDQVPQIAINGIAAGADGLIIEVHPNPQEAKSDGERALLPQTLIALSEEIRNNLPIGRQF